MRFLLLILIISRGVSAFALSPAFDEAQVAASENRYEDVIEILTSVLDQEQLDARERAIAFSNRGIARSLLHDYESALRDLRQAIDLDPEHQLSMNHLGILAEHIYQDYESAARWYSAASVLGYPASKVNLGKLYKLGLGVPRDTQKAAVLFEQAADSSYSPAYVELGAMYLIGEGVDRHYDKALELIRQGIAAGHVSGHFHLGRAYEYGLGVGADFSEAQANYRVAAVQGFAAAQGALGYLYRRGTGVEKNLVEAVRWYRLAAEQGDPVAANRLAWLLAGCPDAGICDGPAALEYAKLAVASERSATNLDTLAAAHARVGEFDQALTILGEILALDGLSDSLREKFSRRLSRYRNGIPFQL
jgi:TPR repeat protein